MTKPKHTPLIQQYFEIKEQHPDTMLFFQVGDFYELFFADAVAAAQFLAITLTKRGKANGEDIPLCGVPVHALTHYLVKLVKGGFTVAICDQVSKPIPGTVVKRAVTKVYTPGTLTDTQLLDEKSASYLCTIFPGDKAYGLVCVELLTAQIIATHIPIDQPRLLEAELSRFFPDEVIIPGAEAESLAEIVRKLGYTVTPLRESATTPPLTAVQLLENRQSTQWVENQFVSSVSAQLIEEPSLAGSVEMLYRSLRRNQESALAQLSNLTVYEPAHYVHLDPATQHNLELVKNQQGSSSHTLFSLVDRARTAMGSRMLKKWLLRPLREQLHIERRHDVVAALVSNVTLMQQLRSTLKTIADLERIVGRIALERATITDYKTLCTTLQAVPQLRADLEPLAGVPLIEHMIMRMPSCSQLVELLTRALNTDENVSGIIRAGFDDNLDRMRDLASNGQQAIANLAAQEAAAHDISSLKILYTSVAGYFIEVTKPNVPKVPEHYRQIATMVNRNRYVTDELKALERDLSQAREDIDSIEKELFAAVEAHVRTFISQLRQMAHAVASLDALYAFADLAYAQSYVRPEFSDTDPLRIEQGRHPVVEQALREQFIANDTALADPARLWIITGPNMGGKSTYLRQVALVSLLAQCGSFVPAARAQLPLVDRIFTRIGAGDNVAQGKSTFLVEMEETATICAQATRNSLVILDEVGRGTSTDDGRALAQAIIEYLVQEVGCYTLFATHYHELTLLSQASDQIANYHMQCVKKGETLHFLHTLAAGVATASFGIDVARLAHLPQSVIVRARHLLKNAAQHELQRTLLPAHSLPSTTEERPLLSDTQRKAIEKLRSLDMNELTPRAAFDALWQLQKELS